MKSDTQKIHAALAEAISNAREHEHDWPCLADIGRACDEHGANFETVCAALGYLPSLSDEETARRGLPYQRSFWINVREVYPDDDRIGVLVSPEAVHAFSEFLKTTGIQPQPLVLVKKEAAAQR